MKLIFYLSVGACLLLSSAIAKDPVSFEREVLPLLEHRCNECHHPEDSQGGLDLTRVATILRGGDDDGPAAIPGNPGESPLVLRVTGETKPRMPKKEEPLPDHEIDLLKRWVAEGARDDTPEFSQEDLTFFEKEIRPVLFTHCFKCHAGKDPESGLMLSSRYGILAGGNRGPVVIPGDPEQSFLLSAVRHEGVLKMPKGGDKLSEEKIASLEEWIRRGLPWPSDEKVLTREKLFTISDADREHWAFRPLPTSAGSIDTILEKRWQAEDLEPAPSADRHRLLRRVSYDLIGYPPTPEEIANYINDDSPGAFEKVVDRLLSSDLYGTRWGRHWLDYTRNGANGQQNRGPEMLPARYAKWVTDCFNQDVPYDWFAQTHLAGDLMPGRDGSGYSIDLALAAAVPLNGARTFQNAATETFALMDKLDEGVEFMGRSLMGISLECARCHDHKFDPISQRDYYALLGFFQSSWFGPVPSDTKSPAEAFAAVERERELLQEKAHFDGLIRVEATRISSHGGELRNRWMKERQGFLKPWDKRLMELEVAVLQGELKASADKKLKLDIQTAIDERELNLSDFKQRFFDVRSLKEIGYQIGGHKSEIGLIVRSEKLGLIDLQKELSTWKERFETERLEWWERHRFGSFRKGDPEVEQLTKWDDEVVKIDAELEKLRAARIVVRCEGGLRRAEELAEFAAEAKADKRQFYPDLVPAWFGDARLLDRGDVMEPRELIPRGFPTFFGGEQTHIDEKSSGRLELAKWIITQDSTQSALVARAAVNRMWLHLFGEGLCRSPKELGRLGEIPEMPELIDALAVKLIKSGWSKKSVIREIVISNAYQQSAITESKQDPANRFFARQNVRRLEAEPIVNTMTWIGEGRRDGNLLGEVHYLSHFDPPTTDDLIEKRVASIAPTQALFLMNQPTATQKVASDLVRRLKLDSLELPDCLDVIYESVYQRHPTDSELTFAREFIERRRSQVEKSITTEEISEFIQLLLCSNELIYLE